MSKFKLRNCQKTALKKFETHFYEENNKKGILCMCCGSGKSIVSYEIIKHCIIKHNETFFVFTSSRLLLLNEYLKNLMLNVVSKKELKKYNFRIFLNMSNNGEQISKLYEKEFNKNKNIDIITKIDTNELINIEKFMKEKNIINIIITTYDSLNKLINKLHNFMKINKLNAYENEHILNECIMIFDEAHNLSSDEYIKRSSFLMNGNNEEEINLFEAKKMLFMTATPLILTSKSIKNNNDYDIQIEYLENKK